MKKPVILVPTDFTPVGDSAVAYATQLSKILDAKIELLLKKRMPLWQNRHLRQKLVA